MSGLPLRPGEEVFSERQLQVLAGIARGDTSKEIGGKLFLGENTIRTHTHEMSRRTSSGGLGHRRAALVDYGYRSGYLASLPPEHPEHEEALTLTPAEERILPLVADGLTNIQIAQITGHSREMIKYIMVALLKKFSARNREHLVALAYQSGHLDPRRVSRTRAIEHYQAAIRYA